MTRSLRAVSAAVLFGSVACGHVVAVRMPNKDPNPQAYYTCEPDGTGFKCDSGQSLHQFDQRLEPSAQNCENGVYEVHIETNWHGGVSRAQYQCAVAPVGGFPAVAASAAAAGGNPGGR